MSAAFSVAVIVFVTVLLRALPFLLFRKKTPEWLLYLGRVLPGSVMAVLVVYCLRGTDPVAWPHGIPEAIACIVTVGLHLWKKNTLLSIGGGTALYMVLIRCVFI